MTPPSRLARIVTFLVACAILLGAVATIRLLINSRPLPKQRKMVEKVVLKVTVIELAKGAHPIKVELFGSVEAEKRYSLRAPFSEKVFATKTLVRGDFVPNSEILFLMSTVGLDFTLGQKEAQLQMLYVDEQRLIADTTFFQSRLKTLADVVSLNQDAINQQGERRRAQEELFASKTELRKKNTVSQTSYLQGESSFRQVELNLISSKSTRANNQERYHFLNQQISENLFNQKRLLLEIQELRYQIGDLLNKRQKARIAVGSSTRVLEVMVDSEEEVTAGQELATLRSTESVLIPITLPDNYFRWLYEGDLLNNGKTAIDIKLVNRGMNKLFLGGSIRSIGGDILPESRSLPIVIQRDNPHNEEGEPVASEELRPGMYCRILLQLCEIPNSFHIPFSTLQAGGRLFSVEEGKLHIISEVTILHENSEGIIVTLPSRYSNVTLVNHPMRQAEEGMRLQVEVTP